MLRCQRRGARLCCPWLKRAGEIFRILAGQVGQRGSVEVRRIPCWLCWCGRLVRRGGKLLGQMSTCTRRFMRSTYLACHLSFRIARSIPHVYRLHEANFDHMHRHAGGQQALEGLVPWSTLRRLAEYLPSSARIRFMSYGS